nr:hypothetical protein [Tanacetum cinerariifolium]
ARIHVERELEMMIIELDRSNEMVAKYLSEYEQAEARLLHDEKVELIDEILMYQRHLTQIKKYQAQQNKPATKTERRDFYISILRGNAGWKAKNFKGMTFEQIEKKFIPVLENMQDFVPRNSKLKRCSKHEGMDQGEDLLVGDTVKDSDKSADKGSDSTDDMANVLGILGAVNILASGGLRSVFTTASLSVATASTIVSPVVATASGSFPTTSEVLSPGVDETAFLTGDAKYGEAFPTVTHLDAG